MENRPPIETARAMVEAYAAKNWSEVWSLASSRIVYDEPATRRKTHGIKRFMSILQGWGDAFPDSRVVVKGMKSFGNLAIFDLGWTGTQNGPIDTPGGTILPTGKKIDLPAGMVVEVVEGKVETVTHHFDMAAMDRQIALTSEEMVA